MKNQYVIVFKQPDNYEICVVGPYDSQRAAKVPLQNIYDNIALEKYGNQIENTLPKCEFAMSSGLPILATVMPLLSLKEVMEDLES